MKGMRTMNFAASDFDYYERTIKVMYQNYYWKRLMVSGIALVIIAWCQSILFIHEKSKDSLKLS
jgi:hypothetical protein